MLLFDVIGLSEYHNLLYTLSGCFALFVRRGGSPLHYHDAADPAVLSAFTFYVALPFLTHVFVFGVFPVLVTRFPISILVLN